MRLYSCSPVSSEPFALIRIRRVSSTIDTVPITLKLVVASSIEGANGLRSSARVIPYERRITMAK